MSVEMFNLQGT